VGEGGAEFVLADPAGPGSSGLAVAEAHQVAVAARAQHRRQAGHVPGAVGVVEDVEHSAVDDRVEGQVQVWKAQRVGDLEAGPQASFGRLLDGPPDGAPGDVDAHRVGTVGGGQQGLLPRAAAGVKHPPGQQALLREPHEGRLRPADIPRRGHARRVRLVPARHGHGVPRYRTEINSEAARGDGGRTG